MTKRIAILGATGHIAKGLYERLLPDYSVTRYSRSEHRPPPMLFLDHHDVIINCIGVGDKLWTDPSQIFGITEMADNVIIDYLETHPETLYINMSSGAVYGEAFDAPVIDGSKAIHDPEKPNFYGIAKLNSEAKHRALDKFNIVDLRVFGYFSEHIRPDDRSIMGEILRCLREDKEMVVSSHGDHYRDYVHPDDLARLVKGCIEMHHLNKAFDVYSVRPALISMILAFFRNHYGLKYRTISGPETSPTGAKPYYYSDDLAAAELGYLPEYSSVEAIRDGAEKLFSHEGTKARREGEEISA